MFNFIFFNKKPNFLPHLDLNKKVSHNKLVFLNELFFFLNQSELTEVLQLKINQSFFFLKDPI